MAKKINIENPVMNFITTPEELEESTKRTEAPKKAEAPEGYKVNPEYIETKSRRVQLLIKPSIYAKVKDLAKEQGTSINDMINTILEKEVM